MCRDELRHSAPLKAEWHGRIRIAITVALTAFYVLVGAPSEAQLPSLIKLVQPPGTEVSPVYRVFGDNANDYLGGGDPTTPSGQLALGDFNGDGFGDLLVGAPRASTTSGSFSGSAYILYGGVGLPGTFTDLNTGGAISADDETRILGGSVNYLAGYAVAAGDFNGDGIDDAIISEPGVSEDNPGRVRVLFGSAALPGMIVNLADPPSIGGIATMEIVGELDPTVPTPTSGLFGRAVAAGNANGDGFDDVIIGAYRTDTPSGSDAGAVYVVFGASTLPGTTITAGMTSASGVSRILGDDAGDRFGWSVATGDANGDGFDDVICGSPSADTPGGIDAGEVIIVYGQPAWAETVDLDGSIGSAGETRILGDDGAAPPASTDNFGCAVASGDVNGDGYDDVLAGAHLATPLSRTRAGEAYVFYGKASLPDSILNMNTNPNGSISDAGETRLLGALALDWTGFSVGAGDVDGDGRSDVLVGAWQVASTGGLQQGRVFLVPGSTVPAASNVDLASFSSRVEVRGEAALDWFGSAAVAGADMDRDGYGDFIGSGPGGNNLSIDNAGYAAVVFGDGTSATATAATYFAAGTTPLKGLGGRLSPGVRTWISFTGGAAVSKATATLTRSGADITSIPEATSVDIAQVLWHLTTDRTSWTSAHVILRYADSEVAGMDETKLVLYRADSPAGPWNALASAALDPDRFNSARNEVSADVLSLGYFAIAADTGAPALSIGAPSIDLTRDTPVTYTVTYSRAITVTLSDTDVHLDTTGTANATLAVSGTGTASRTITLSNVSGDGTVGISIDAGTASDGSGNFALGAGPSVTFRVDNTAPEIAIGEPSLTQTTSGPVTYSVLYSGASAVTLSNADVQLVTTGSANADWAVSGETGSTLRIVTLSNITGTGTLSIGILAGTATDEVDNSALVAGPAMSFVVDNTPPTVIIGAPSVTDTKAGPVSYTITYGGATAVTLTASKVTLNRTGTANGTVAVSGSGLITRTVTISSITGDGTLGITLQAGTATDGFGNTALSTGPSTTFTVDNTAPTVSIGAPSDAQTRIGPVSFTIAYGGASSISLTSTNVSLVSTGTATGDVTVQGSGSSTRTVVIDNITGDGTLGISLAAGTASDAAGNTALAAGPSADFTVDNTAPTVSIGEPSIAQTQSGPVSFTIGYVDATNVSLTSTDITLVSTGTATGVVTVQGSGSSTRTVVIDNITGDGALGISLAASTASDGVGNTALAAGPSTTFTVDNTEPAVSIGAPSVTQTQSGPVTFEITYTDATGITLTSPDVTLILTGTATGTVSIEVSGALSRTVRIDSITGDGTLGIALAAGTAVDSAGNLADATAPSANVAVGSVELAVSLGTPSVAATVGGPVTFVVAYTGADEVTLSNSHISLVTTGTAAGTYDVQGSGTAERTVVISNITGDGTLAITVAEGTASNTIGNIAQAVGPSGSVLVDNTPPTIAIGEPSVTTVTTGPVSVVVTYSDATGITLVQGDVSLVTTGGVTGTVSVIGSGATTRTVTVSSITGNGTLAISIAAGTAADSLGNLALAAGPSGIVIVQNTTFNPADVNRDGKIDAADVQLVINAALGKPAVGFPDVSGDGKVNATDVQLVINAVLGRG